jgi:hypothetical protein
MCAKNHSQIVGPTSVNFEMGSSEVVSCDISVRFFF